jgi:prevent-host-death family protein
MSVLIVGDMVIMYDLPSASIAKRGGGGKTRQSGIPPIVDIGMARHHTGHNDRYDLDAPLLPLFFLLGGKPMIRQTNAVAFRQNLGEMLNQVQYRRDSVVINKDGKPVAALVDARLFERIRRMQARFESLCERFESGFAAIDEPEGMAEIDKAVKQDRAQQKKKSKSR